MAPGVTFWDAGEFIAAAHGFGIPHPPGTPLYVALGRAWTALLAPLLGTARAMNLLSALGTALAGGCTAWVIARELRAPDAAWGALAGVVCAGLMTSVWSDATETEVYAIALLHAALMLACASRAGEDGDVGTPWLRCTAYAIALAPGAHLSALVGAPAAIALAARSREGGWRPGRVLLLGGVGLATAGVGRMSLGLVAAGVGVALLSSRFAVRGVPRRTHVAGVVLVLLLAALAYSALFILLLRARHDPPLDQGNPSSLPALADVVARRQYDVAGLLPRQAPVWLQVANIAQYADWQVALDWGHGIFTTPARVLAALAFVALAFAGAGAMRRDDRRFADALLVLLTCGTIGVAAYLNFKAGASLGWGLVPDTMPHEARERDYFFVLGFWAWGCLAGYGALAAARRYGRAPWLALAVCIVPLAGNWRGADRSRAPDAAAARDVSHALLSAAPRNAVLFAGGDNDTYPLWYAQQVEGMRRDVLVVTLPLLPADWYASEIARRTGWRWRANEPVAGARWSYEQRAALVAREARAAGRPIAATPLVTAHERAFLGTRWRLAGPTYVSDAAANGRRDTAVVDRPAALRWIRDAAAPRDRSRAKVDDVAGVMLELLDCPRLALGPTRLDAGADSLEVKCNLQ